MVRAGGIAIRRSDATIFLRDQILAAQILVRAVAPVSASARVEALGERLSQSIRQRLHHDGGIVVVVSLVLLDQRVDADAGGHSKGAKVIDDAAVLWSDEVGERAVRPPVGDDLLLSQHVEPQQLLPLGSPPRDGRPVHDDVVAVAVGGPEPVDAPGRDELLRDDSLQQRGRVFVEVPRSLAISWMIEDRWEFPLQLPRRKEERPVDVAGDLLKREVRQHSTSGKRRPWNHLRRPRDPQPVGQRGLVGQQRFLPPAGVLLAELLLTLPIRLVELRPLAWAQQARHDVHDT